MYSFTGWKERGTSVMRDGMSEVDASETVILGIFQDSAAWSSGQTWLPTPWGVYVVNGYLMTVRDALLRARNL